MASAQISTNTDASREWEDYCELGVAVTPLNLHEEGTLQNLSVTSQIEESNPSSFARTVLISMVLGAAAWYGIYRIIRAAIES